MPAARKRVLMPAAGASLLLAALLATAIAATGGAAAGATAAAGCTVPVTHDPYDGYHVGIPSGWSVFKINGRLVVTPSGTSPEQSIVAPVLLTRGLTAAKFFAAEMTRLDKEIDAIGNSMTYRITSTSGGIPQATLTGRAGSTPVTGRATVIVLPDRTAHGSQLAVLSAYWAPPAQFDAQRSKLAGIALCFGPERAPLFQVFKDQVFTYAMPPGFKVTQEGQDFLQIQQGNNAWATFLLTFLTPATGVNSVQTLQQYLFSHSGFTNVQIVTSATSPKQSSNGAVNQLEDLEFTGTYQGVPVHGLAAVYASIGVDISGTMRIAMTRTSYWNSTGGAVLRIAAGVQHSFSQDLQQWERLSAEQQQFGAQVSGFDEALNGEDLVQNTATGQTFEAPYNSFQQSGPDGPGYYTGSAGSLQKLQVITPS